MPTGQSGLGNSSDEVPFSGDSILHQIDNQESLGCIRHDQSKQSMPFPTPF